MNKSLLSISMALAVAPLLLCTPVHATQPGYGFAGAQLGQSRLQGMAAAHDTATGAVFNLGYRWKINPGFEIGPEVGYTTLGSFSDTFYLTQPGKVTAKVRGAFAGANARFLLGPDWYIQMQTGYFNAHSRIDTRYGASVTAENYTTSSWYTGLGFGYRFASNASLGFVFNHFNDRTHGYDLGSSLASVRVEYQF